MLLFVLIYVCVFIAAKLHNLNKPFYPLIILAKNLLLVKFAKLKTKMIC